MTSPYMPCHHIVTTPTGYITLCQVDSVQVYDVFPRAKLHDLSKMSEAACGRWFTVVGQCASIAGQVGRGVYIWT